MDGPDGWVRSNNEGKVAVEGCFLQQRVVLSCLLEFLALVLATF